MKVKLLKKVRKRFVIKYYPLGIEINDGEYIEHKYDLVDKNNPYFTCFTATKQQALNVILSILRLEYKYYSIKYKSKDNTPIIIKF